MLTLWQLQGPSFNAPYFGRFASCPISCRLQHAAATHIDLQATSASAVWCMHIFCLLPRSRAILISAFSNSNVSGGTNILVTPSSARYATTRRAAKPSRITASAAPNCHCRCRCQYVINSEHTFGYALRRLRPQASAHTCGLYLGYIHAWYITLNCSAVRRSRMHSSHLPTVRTHPG